MFGCCKSRAQVVADVRDRDIDSKNAADAEREAQRVKLLLLGAGESGKSTLLKQFRVLFGPGYSDADRAALTPVVHANTMASIRALLAYAVESGYALPTAELRSAAQLVTSVGDPFGTAARLPVAAAPVSAAASAAADVGTGTGTVTIAVAAAGQSATGGALAGSTSDSGSSSALAPATASGESGAGAGAGAGAAAGAGVGAGAGAGAMAIRTPPEAGGSALAAAGAGGPADSPGGLGAGLGAGVLGMEPSMLTPAVADAVAALWASEPIQRAYSERSRFQLLDSAAFWLDRARAIATPGYVPSVEDVMRVRVRTSGILDEKYSIDNVHYTIYDVGGQRNERRKWIHCFADVTAIIFVAAISEYDQTLYEENTANRLVEAIELFGKVCGSRHFEETPIILFLNKRDIFETKIKTRDLRVPNPDPFKAEREPVLFADYDGGCDYEKALRYILGRFLAQNTNPRKTIFWRVTVATDPDNVRTVFAAAREIILQQNLLNSGMLEP